MPLPTAQQPNLPACSLHCPFNSERQASKEAVNTNFKVIGLTRLGIKLKSTAPEADALTTRPFELFKINLAAVAKKENAALLASISNRRQAV